MSLHDQTITAAPPVEVDQLHADHKAQGDVLMLEQLDHNATPGQDLKLDHVPQSDMAYLTQRQAYRKFWKASLYCAMVSFGAMMDGYHGSIDGNIVANQGFVKHIGGVVQNNGVLAVDAYHVSAWGGISSGCVIFANLFGGFTADWFGRKFNMWVIWVLLVAGTVVELVAKDWRGWAGAKAIIGLAGGLYNTSLVIQNAEMAPAQIRGGLLSTYALGNALGGIVGTVGLEILASSKYAEDYKRVLYSEFLLEALFIPCLFLVPESPWHYARKEKHDKGRKSMRTLYGNVDGFDVDHEYDLIVMAVEHSRQIAEAEGRISWYEIFRGTNLRRFAISAALPMAGKLTGNPLVGNYTSYFFQLAGLKNPFLVTMIVNLVQLVFIILSLWTIDFFGRRTLLLGAVTTISFSMLSIGICGFSIEKPATQHALVAFTCIFFAAYATGIAPVGPSYQGETATPRLRAKTNSISQACGQSWGLIFAYTIPLMLSTQGAGWGVKAAFFFLCTNTILGVLFYFFMPEYKGRSYAELDELFERRIPARKFKTTKTAAQLEREQTTAAMPV